MAITTSGNRYEGAKPKKDPIVVMKTGGQASIDLPSMNYSERLDFINKKYTPNIVDAGFYFMIHETGFDYPLNDDSSEIRKMLVEYYKSQADYTEETLEQSTIYKVDEWELVRKEIDPETDEEYDTTELEQVSADNTYNFSYLGAIDLDWRVYYDADYEKYFYVIHPHLGGDIRGNYGDAIILEGDDKEELFYRFYGNFISGSASIYLKFKDDSEITFNSEQDSDVFYFRFEDDEPSKNSIAGKYLADFKRFDGWKGDEFLQETIQEFDKGKEPKMSLGGGIESDDTPKAYVQILGYPEGKWIDLTDFSDGEEVMESIYDWMKELNKADGGSREEYEVHDYEGFGKKLYSESMGESEFDEIIEGYEAYEKCDYPVSVIEEYMVDNGMDEYDDAIKNMNEKYYGSYKSLSDWAYQMVKEGVYIPSASDMYVTDTDKRIIASEEADKYVETMTMDDFLEVVDKQDEFDKEKERLDEQLNVVMNKLDTIEFNIDKAEGDEDLLESLTDEHSDTTEEYETIKSKIETLEEVFFQKYKDDAISNIYDKIYSQLSNDLEGFLEEYGFTGEITSYDFVNVDYDELGKDLQGDYNVYEHNRKYFVFTTYKGGGKVSRIGKPNPKFTHYIIEMGSSKIVSGFLNRNDAMKKKTELTKKYPKITFGVYPKDKAEIKFALDTMTYRDWIDLSQINSVGKLAISSKRKSIAKDGAEVMPRKRNTWDKTKHYARVGMQESKNAFQDAKSWAETNDVKGRIKRGIHTAVDKTKQGASWLQQQWRDADFGDGKGKAKFFEDGGGVEFIEYKGKEIMYEPHDKKYYANDEEFDSLEDAKKFIDSGETPHHIREAYRRGYFKGGGHTTKAYAGGGDVSRFKVGNYVTNSKGKSFGFGVITAIYDKMAVVDFEEIGEVKTISLYDLKKINKLYAGGGGVETYTDLFEDYENIPDNVQEILNEYELEGSDYSTLKELVGRLEGIGYTFDYGLDAEPYGLRPVGVELNQLKGYEEFLRGGDVTTEQKEQNDMCIDIFVEFVTNIVDVKYAFTDDHNNKLVFVLEKDPMIETIEDMNEFLRIAEDDCKNIFVGDVEFSRDSKVLSISLKPKAYTKFNDGGEIPEQEKMFHLPLEMVVYVPSTQDVDKVISVDEMDKRVNEVKTYLANKFGGYSSADKLGGFVDSNGNLVNEEVVQVVSFSTQEAFDKNKNELIKQLSKWGEEWGQEAIGFEFEGDLFYVPQEGQMMKRGGDVWIQDAVNKMKSKDTLGAFTKQAKKHKQTPVEFAKQVLENPKNYHMKTFRRAMFVKNTNPELF